MRLIFISFFITCFYVFAHAQTISISKAVPVSSRTYKFKLLGKNNVGYWVRNFGKNEERIDVYDDALNLVRSKSLLIKRNNFSTVSYFLGSNQASIFYTEYKKRSLVLYASAINERLETGQEYSLDTIRYQSSEDPIAISYASSNNKMYHMFFIPQYTNASFSSIRVIGTLGTPQVKFKSIISIAMDGYDAYPEDAIVTNEGITYVLIRYKSYSRDSSYYMAYRLNNAGKNDYILPITFYKYIKGETHITYDHKSNDLLVAALSGDNLSKGASYLSVYRMHMDDSMQATLLHYKIDQQIIDEIYNQKEINTEGLYTFQLKKIILTNQRGIYALSESVFKESREEIAPDMLSMSPMYGFQPMYGSGVRSVNIFHYNDVLCLKLNNQTQTLDYELIQKNQRTENDNGGYSSFAVLNSGTDIRLLYNDDSEAFYSLTEVCLDKTKEDRKKVLLNEEKKSVQLIPKLAIQTGINEIVMPSYRNDEFKLIRIKY